MSDTKELIESEKSTDEIVKGFLKENRQFGDDEVGKGQVGIRYYEGSYQFASEIVPGNLKDAQKKAMKKLQDQKDSRPTDKTLWATFTVDGNEEKLADRVKIK